MNWSLRLGSLFGIPVCIHWTFVALLAFVGLSPGLEAGTLGAALGSILFLSAVFGCVLLHELGHALMARRFGIHTRDVTLLPFGGVARLGRMPTDPRQEMAIALAGPAINVGIAMVLALLVVLSGSRTALGLSSGSFVAQLLAVNIGLVLFNLLPAFPMDGGRVLRALLARRSGYVTATDVASTIGRGMAVLFGIAGLFWSSMLIVIAVFLWFAATEEARAARATAAWSPRPGFDAPYGAPHAPRWHPMSDGSVIAVHDDESSQRRGNRRRSGVEVFDLR